MPLTDLQRDVVDILKQFRNEASYVAGGAALNADRERLSDDLDIFTDLSGTLPHAVEPELEALSRARFAVTRVVLDPIIVEVIAARNGRETKIQWFEDAETCLRFFPAEADDRFGFRLHDADLAVNKMLCLARRTSAPRDAVDLLQLVSGAAPLGPLIWATVGKVPDRNPNTLIAAIRRTAMGYSEEEVRTVRMQDGVPVSRAALRDTVDAALDEAIDYCSDVAPVDHVGCLFVDRRGFPVMASQSDIETGAATSLPIKRFPPNPEVLD